MTRQPIAARLLDESTVEIYDQNGTYLYRAHVGPNKATGAVVNGNSLAVSLSDGRVQVFEMGPNQSPVLRYTR